MFNFIKKKIVVEEKVEEVNTFECWSVSWEVIDQEFTIHPTKFKEFLQRRMMQ
jgi:hypothetical protein